MTIITAEAIAVAIAAMTEARNTLQAERLFVDKTPFDPTQIGRLLGQLEIATCLLRSSMNKIHVEVRE